MKSKELASLDISTLRNEKGNICISVIVPTHRLSPDRRVDKPQVNKAMDKARQLLRYKYPEADATRLLQRMDEVVETIDFSHNMDGLGLYISNGVTLCVRFPFNVEEKIIVNHRFELRDLLYKEHYASLYYILLLTEQEVRLFNGCLNDLSEIKDDHFPMYHKDDYIYASPAPSSSLSGYAHVKSFEKDKSQLEVIRLKDSFKKVDKLLKNYLFNDVPLIILGVKKELSLFTEVSSHNQNIIGKVAGSYNYNNEKQLAEISWPCMQLHLDNEGKNLVKEFEEKVGKGLGISGIKEVWAAVREGKAFHLLVERSYRLPAFLAENEYHLYLQPPKENHKVLTDAVDDIIETVLEKKGHVHFVDNGILKDYQHIALITRYKG